MNIKSTIVRILSNIAVILPITSIWLLESQRLKFLPRAQKSRTILKNKKIEIADGPSSYHMIEKIIRQESLKFKPKKLRPLIIDCGANIGISTIFFKEMYKEARIIAFEPDQAIFNILQHNLLTAFEFEDVVLINKGVWSTEGYIPFYSTGTDAGKIVKNESLGNSSIEVTSLRKYHTDEIDLLKIDIEGAEVEVLKNCSDLLQNTRFLFVEYHSSASEDQELDVLLGILKQNGFKYYIESNNPRNKQPFMKTISEYGFDFQLNIFASRNEVKRN